MFTVRRPSDVGSVGVNLPPFSLRMEKPDEVTQFVEALGNMISIHCNNAIALSLLPKLKSPFVLLPAATPWKKKSGMLGCTAA